VATKQVSLVIGAGSIGMKHARALETLGHEVVFVTSREDVYHQKFRDVSAAVQSVNPSYAVIANPTHLHAEAAQGLSTAGYSGRVLVEKPAQLDDVDMSGFEEVAIGFNLRFHPCLIALKEALASSTVFAVECYVGQDLRTWREDRDVKSQYSAHKNQGGGVLRDLSHELDYLTWIFGSPIAFAAIGGRLSDITVDSDDSWAIIGELENAPQFSLQLNYLDTIATRTIRVLTTRGSFSVDLVRMTVEQNEKTHQFEGATADTYGAMHRSFLSGSPNPLAGVDEARAVDKWIDDIEDASASKQWKVYA
jgi:predicted dehydrogenase